MKYYIVVHVIMYLNISVIPSKKIINLEMSRAVNISVDTQGLYVIAGLCGLIKLLVFGDDVSNIA